MDKLVQKRAEKDEDDEIDWVPPGMLAYREKFVNQEAFHHMCAQAFEEVDLDSSGGIDLAEFYAGVLLLYDRLNRIPWGGRKKPPPRQKVEELFVTYLEKQEDGSELNYDSFEKMCKNHFDQLIESLVWRILLISVLYPYLSVKLAQLVLKLPGLESTLGELASIVPTLCVSTLVTLTPYLENLVASQLTKEQRVSLDGTRRLVERTIRTGFNDIEREAHNLKDFILNIPDMFKSKRGLLHLIPGPLRNRRVKVEHVEVD